MGILERIAKAETSSDLKHHERECDVDVLGAIGMAAIRSPGHLAIYRVKYLHDLSAAEEAFGQFVYWAKRSLARRCRENRRAKRIAGVAFEYWLNDVCDVCDGLRYAVIDGTPCLSDRPCELCRGSGKRILRGEQLTLDVVGDVMERAHNVVLEIERVTGLKFYAE